MTTRHDYEATNTSNRGEKDTYHAIKKALVRQMPQTRVLSNVILPLTRIDESKSPATAEYDAIAITPYGVVVFEIKDWSGWRLSRGPINDNGYPWILDFAEEGPREERRNAVGQCFGKTRHLSESLGFWTTSYVVITDDDMILDHRLGAHVIQQKELGYVPRLIYQLSKKIQNGRIPDSAIDKIADSILENSAGITREQHIANVKAYLALNGVMPKY